MTNSKHIAKLIGPTLIVMTITEIMNPHIWDTVPATQTYLAGSLWFIAGLAIIRSHNRWALNWSVLITFIGWFALLGGTGRMFFPEPAQQSKTGQNAHIILAVQIVLLVIGIILTHKAYCPFKNKMSTKCPACYFKKS